MYTVTEGAIDVANSTPLNVWLPLDVNRSIRVTQDPSAFFFQSASGTVQIRDVATETVQLTRGWNINITILFPEGELGISGGLL
jgi:hypothetical protein